MTASTRERRAARPSPGGARTGGGVRWRGPAWLDGPMTSSHLVLGSAGLLLVVGLVMVFSASSIEAAKAGQPAWLPGVRQIGFALVGLLGMLVALRLPIGRLRRWSGPGMLVVFGLLALVLVPIPGVSLELNGARAWFNLGFTNFQPSELAKLVFALWGAHVIAVREKYLTTRSLLVPVLPVFLLMSLLLLAEPDMGAVVSLLLVVAGLMWAGGLSRRWVGVAVLAVGVVVALMVVLAPYRMARVTGFIDPCADVSDSGYQACHGLYALATGGFWGVGLGNSAMKWNLLPHAESDYIFAIIGEELGFLGCLVVVCLYAILGWAGFRIARRSTDRFIQLASIAITVWLIGQATMNMGYVVGLLPVTGVTLPLISAGGTSLVLTLFVIGLLARFARAEPAAIAFQRSQPRGRLARLLLPVPPTAVDPVPPPRRRRGRRGADPGRDLGPVRRPERHDGRTVTRVPDPGAGRGRAGAPPPRRWPDPRRGTPDERRRAPERQTVPGRPNAGDRPSVRNRPVPPAVPVLRDVPRERPRSGEPPAARVRPATRPHPPRTERPGRLQ
ncbi:Cell division protein FtsW [Modestobacter italicus]|uniref:Probable peptidoglycan glycosyltransferase FtsW n=1 Tax=Modestobacter italicus (strain DSM 44449 / CECT 9708 / BC 501) TaxID=2732864 RepID=I4EZQ5_MODI5|nr:putative lipid II flippase FtsW [Modestobacter marinus]CCH88868.1 Cell division protein FtsW [Modestobacter marinus]